MAAYTLAGLRRVSGRGRVSERQARLAHASDAAIVYRKGPSPARRKEMLGAPVVTYGAAAGGAKKQCARALPRARARLIPAETTGPFGALFCAIIA